MYLFKIWDIKVNVKSRYDMTGIRYVQSRHIDCMIHHNV